MGRCTIFPDCHFERSEKSEKRRLCIQILHVAQDDNLVFYPKILGLYQKMYYFCT